MAECGGRVYLAGRGVTGVTVRPVRLTDGEPGDAFLKTRDWPTGTRPGPSWTTWRASRSPTGRESSSAAARASCRSAKKSEPCALAARPGLCDTRGDRSRREGRSRVIPSSRLYPPLSPSLCSAGRLARAVAAAADLDHFEKKIRPVLVEHCYKCHSAEARRRRSSRAACSSTPATALLKGGDTGPAVVPGKPDESLLIKALQHDGDAARCRPRASCPTRSIADFETWVDDGRPDPRDGDRRPRKQVGIERRGGPQVLGVPAADEAAAPPAVKDAAWPATDIDRFILARLEAKGLQPAADADRATLLRRRLLRPDRPAADARGGRRLRRRTRRPTPSRSSSTGCSPRRSSASAGAGTGSTSPATPSRARSAASSSRTPGATATTSSTRSTRDMPFDRFVREQLAGDLLPAADARRPPPAARSPPAFLALGNTNLEEQDKKQLRDGRRRRAARRRSAGRSSA